MRTLPNVTDLRLVGIFDPGVPYKERVVMQADAPLNLADFALVFGRLNGTAIQPSTDQFFWFGDLWILPGTWVIVMTCPGSLQTTKDANQKDVHWLYWGKKNTVFPAQGGAPGSELGVGLLRIGGIEIAAPSGVLNEKKPDDSPLAKLLEQYLSQKK